MAHKNDVSPTGLAVNVMSVSQHGAFVRGHSRRDRHPFKVNQHNMSRSKSEGKDLSEASASAEAQNDAAKMLEGVGRRDE